MYEDRLAWGEVLAFSLAALGGRLHLLLVD